MSRIHKIAAILYGKIILLTSVSSFNHKPLELQTNLNDNKLTNYLSRVICSIDIKVANIYFGLQSEDILDGIIDGNATCVRPSIKIVALVSMSIKTSALLKCERIFHCFKFQIRKE